MKLFKACLLAFGIQIAAGAAYAEDIFQPLVWESEGVRVETATFACGVDAPGIDVAFLTAKDGTSFAVLTIDGVLVPMVQIESGSGVRYAAVDEQLGYRVHTKGNDLLVSRQPADDSAGEEDLYTCQAVVPQ